MRTARVLAGLVLVATFAAACGVAADDRAAVVLGTPVSTSTVDDLAADEAFLQAVGGGLPGTESVVPGDSARAALTFEIQRAAAETELERWGLSLDDALVAEARGSVEQQVPPGLGDRALDELARFVAATTALGNRLTAIDPSDEEDLRRLYDGAPSLWARTCVAVLAVAEEQAATVVDLVGSGRQVEEVVAEIEESQLVFDPADACVPTAQLPGDLREAIERATPGSTPAPVTIESQTGPVAVFFRVDGRERLGFDDEATREQLASIVERFGGSQAPSQAAGFWLNLILPDAVDVNPRYGRPVVGPSGTFEVAPPEAPLVSIGDTEIDLPVEQVPVDGSGAPPSQQRPATQPPAPEPGPPVTQDPTATPTP
ncbi:MAG: hypothetical protein ACOYOQ_16100 [Microthrixaceae bacterium]|jgi:hypothetical protein